MSTAGLTFAAPTGQVRSLAQTVADAADTISEAPATHLHRATLHGVYMAARAARDDTELAQALTELRDRADGRDLPDADFDHAATAALEIARRRRA